MDDDRAGYKVNAANWPYLDGHRSHAVDANLQRPMALGPTGG